jgi:hypothetical protein
MPDLDPSDRDDSDATGWEGVGAKPEGDSSIITSIPHAAGKAAPGTATTPEGRVFDMAELHPCVRRYGACRQGAERCVFARSPANLCVDFVRFGGACPRGAECGWVHRLPANDAAVMHLYRAMRKC